MRSNPIVKGVEKQFGTLTEEDLNWLIDNSHPGLQCTEDDIVKWITENEDIRILNLMMIESNASLSTMS
jgi:hypothetical protein